MIETLFFSREAFAARRRKSQDEAVSALGDAVANSIKDGSASQALLTAVGNLFLSTYQDEAGKPLVPQDDKRMGAAEKAVQELFKNVTPSSDRSATALAIATLTINLAVSAAAQDDEDDVFLEWVTMHDGAVRQAHKDTDGQVRPIGEKFDVDGTAMAMPGDITVPIELWINCRCTLRPTLASEDNKEFQSTETPVIQIPTATSGHTGNGNQIIYNGNLYATNTTTTTGIFTMTTDTKKPEADLSGFEGMDEEQIAALEMLVPWHGVLAPEGVSSGDGRTFAPNSLSNRDLPLPLTYQKAQDDGHNGSVVVGSIETLERVDGLMLATGWMLSTPEADEVIGLMAHFGKYGVSVDADEAEFDFNEDEQSITFSKARICSASLVSIPAFAEAYVALGPWEEDAALVASGSVFKDLAPGRTEDGPGWLTHPIDTDRLRDYWVRGPGAAKIGWGTPGDFNRCRLNLAKYVKPQFLSGYCANRHYDALGFWPGRPVAGDTIPFVEGSDPAPALTLVASATKQITAPAAWFENPNFTKVTHLTVTTEGRVFGHVAEWGVCHIGMQGVCVDPPRSLNNYSSFANKAVLLDNGEFAKTGVITIGGKHAPGMHGLRAASRHYDDHGMAGADVSIGEDQFGIWVAGWVRPGTTPENIVALRASDISGDWRSLDGFSQATEMVGILAVNSGGFPVRVAASGGNMVSLVAAGMIQSTEDDLRGFDAEVLAEAMVKAFERAEQNRKDRAAKMASLRTKIKPEEE